MDDYGWNSPGSISGWSLTLTLDSTPPVSTLTTDSVPNANGWYTEAVDLVLEATDESGGAGVRYMRFFIHTPAGYNLDSWIHDSRGELPPLTEGVYDVSFYAVDFVGNIEVKQNRVFRVDTRAPTLEPPTFRLALGTLTAAGVPVAVHIPDWDDGSSTGGSGSGIRRCVFQQRTNNGIWKTIPGSGTPRLLQLAPSNTYQFRAWVVDFAGYRSSEAYSERKRVQLYQEANAAIVDTGTWTTASSSLASGGQVQYATEIGREVLFTFTGTDVALVTTRGPDFGGVRYAFDESWICCFDFYSPTLEGKQVRAPVWATNGIHNFRVSVGRANSASAGARVDVDAFVVLKLVP